jgi:hypothetical protein
MRDLIDAVETGIAAGRSKQALVDSVLLEQYSHMRSYDAYRASNVAGAYEILISSGR